MDQSNLYILALGPMTCYVLLSELSEKSAVYNGRFLSCLRYFVVNKSCGFISTLGYSVIRKTMNMKKK